VSQHGRGGMAYAEFSLRSEAVILKLNGAVCDDQLQDLTEISSHCFEAWGLKTSPISQ
jgi:hypothetical protein